MKRFRFIGLVLLLLMFMVFCATSQQILAAGSNSSYQAMPPNEVKILSNLLHKNNLVIDDSNPSALRSWDGKRITSGGPTAITSSAANELLKNYLKQKLRKKPGDRPNILALKNKNLRRFQPKGKSLLGKSDEAELNCQDIQTDKILILLVEFSDVVHNQLPKPDPGNNIDYWVSDFNSEHYQSMLFSRKKGALSMSNYFLEQSQGTYTVDGQICDWVKVKLPAAEYGADSEDGTDDANGPVWRIVRDAVAAAGTNIDWAQYDQVDPADLDQDGVFDEPDGYIDHLMLVHSGAGQEAGGGSLGNDAIWSHSWFADGGIHGPGFGGVPTANPAVWAGPYTIMPEDGAIGVFCHEFAHDLGLPDEYDTIYSGESSPAYWSLMASGSWLGDPLGTKPSGISIWGRVQLGWIKPQVVDFQRPFSSLWLDPSGKRGASAIQINLPDKNVVRNVNTPYSGQYEWYSGAGDGLNQTLSRTLDLTGTSSATLRFWTWYNIEEGYDFGYVEVSTDNGANWTNLPGNITSVYGGDNAVSGQSDWVEAMFDLSAYAGRQILLRFRYYTDGGLTLPGWAIDDITVDAVGFSDDCENGKGNWVANGWTLFEGTSTEICNHYYLLEQRNFKGFDESLSKCYAQNSPRSVGFFPYSPGVLLWYYDGEYKDNWVGVHPGKGFLLVVDSHPVPDSAGSNYLRTRYQIRDAAFGTAPTLPATISYRNPDGSYSEAKFPAKFGNPYFDDHLSYWYDAKGDNSVIVPKLGVNFLVLQSGDKSFIVLRFE
ncbi:MAG TPA: immune inhibitor A domain-containing protein [Bacillota bacterium]|nr:immune inhibitor A domain-containing protein [Bacillota bacterium]